MANRIKGITVEIGGDTTKLQTALKGVNGQIKNTQSALKDVERLLKLDPTNTNLLAQKQKLLTQAIGETKEKLNTLKTAAQQANEQLQKGEITQEQYDALQREIAATEAELKRLESQASKTNQTLTKIGEVGGKLENAGDSIANAGKKVSVASAAVTAMGGAAVKTAADFESSMSQVQATMGITKNSMSKVNGQSVNTMDTLSDLAKTMGAKTAYSASECAEALNYLALAGYDTQEMCDTLPTVLNLAAAGNIDLASASDMVTDAMSALGLKTKDADKMVDQMAKTASSTNTSVGQLGEGILTIGATAKSVKGGTAELNTALGILANNGIKGAEGGTHLRNVILSLQNPTDGAAKTMEKLGVKTYDSEGNMRSLNDILGDLNKSMDGIRSGKVEGYTISKIPLTKLKLKNGGIDKYYKPESDTLLYNALLQRLEEFNGNAEKAFAEEFHKPKADGTPGPVVKKVKIIEKSSSNVKARNENKLGVADNGSMVRIDVFYVDGEGYYFVPIYVSDTVKPSLPNLACSCGKSGWKEMDDKDFVFSLYSNDLIRITAKKDMKFSLVNKDSTLPSNKFSNGELVYYIKAGISTASITIETHDGAYAIQNCGIKTLTNVEKYIVDPLGNVNKVKKEKRMYFK